MSTDDECKHGLMVGTCSLCAPRPVYPPGHSWGPPERTMASRFDSRCPGCTERITEGDTIGLIDGEWLCWRCVG